MGSFPETHNDPIGPDRAFCVSTKAVRCSINVTLV